MRSLLVLAALFATAIVACSASESPVRSDAGAPADSPEVGRECVADESCSDHVECTVDRCVEGRCVYEAVAMRCGAGSTCDPTHGCLPRRACTVDRDCADTDLCTANERCQIAGNYCVFDALPNDSPCGSGRICLGGACACPASRPTLCGDVCVDLRTDSDRCGNCSASCGAGAWCNDSRCTCSMPQTWCPRTGCTDLTLDSANCGACGNACTAPSTCQASRCVAPCPPMQHRCGDACVSTEVLATCGLRCEPCPAPMNGVGMCLGGGPAASCSIMCNPGYHACGTRCAGNNDPDTCGDRCSPCPLPDHGTVACTGGACQVTCEAHYHRCGDTCSPDDNVNSCGGLCTPCPAPMHAVASCAMGACDFTCAAGFRRCTDICSDGTSVLGCGPSCTRCPVPTNGSATCSAGACGFTCRAGYHACGSACADDNSPITCGALCTPCPAPPHAGPACTAGACGFECDPGYTREGDLCREIPRLLWPPSGSFTTGRRPTFRWTLPADVPAGALLEVCRDRACSMVVTTLPGASGTGRPASDLPLATVFWRVRAGTLSSAVWPISISGRAATGDAPVGSWGDNPDFNGDGFADLAVGAPFLGTPGARLYILRGSAAGVVTAGRLTIDDPAPPVPGALPTQFAWSLAAADFNGDGYTDLAAGTPGYNGNTGRAYVFYGSSGGLAPAPTLTLEGRDGEHAVFGVVVVSAGDLNADGYNDLVVGAPGARDGVAYVYYGGGRGLTRDPSVTLPGPVGSTSHFGAGLANGGDLDADGDSDLVVGAPEYTAGVGRAFVYLGSPTGPASAATALTDPFGGRIGTAVAGLGDVNGDGYPDIAVGAPAIDNGTGRVHVYNGSAMGITTTAATTLIGPAGMEGDFGSVIAGAGDTNGDGYADLLASAPRVDTYTGRVYVFQGSATGVPTTVAQNLFDVSAGRGALFGGALGGARDVDNDGYSDAVISAERATSYTGQVTILRGGMMGLANPTVLTGAAGPGTRFGISVAWRDQVCRAPRGV